MSDDRIEHRGDAAINCDVTIIGAGPVGSLLAVLLQDFGVSTVLVERDLQPYQLPRAIVMDEEIQRVFHQHRMGAWISATTTPLKGADFVSPTGDRILGIEIPSAGPLGLAPVVCHYQPDLDAFVQTEAERRGSTILRGRTAATLDDSRGEHIRLTLDNGDTVSSRWLVGCDGASSWTRKQVGLSLEDLKFDQQWLVVDLELHDASRPELPDVLQQVCDPLRPVTYVPGHARYRRWEFQIQPDDDLEVVTTESGIWSLLEGWVKPADARLVRSAVYRFHAVVAPSMHKGNVFLAGDSAHQMPPFLGQGLNSGTRDAVSLAWKMALVRHGSADERLLDTYAVERVPHVRSTVEHAADMGRLIDQIAGRESHGLDRSSGYGGSRPQPFIEAGLVVHSDESVGRPLRFDSDVYAALVEGGPHFVIATNNNVDAKFGAPTRVVRVANGLIDDRYAIVVRPDGVVAAVAHDDDELRSSLRTLEEYL
ncbi:MAG: FAD-dependent monooxygenase [Actinomycetota bacterium]